mmetsp:Transcript_83637/g.240349  ORF Transcript_83637/g.240349 Transcript_83637/m.240349 type:complete len:310 (+) Transcript_83637:65-994(+)|eukprot:CAMPEP_0177194042 /NCGR_PEP_ID=MMETSP0367-20130122/22763_1 /TAXON_ID=447022 ORGANISM="Scrippsiella hangoei-like, Strain SHHI-4" /NCGR_SAMPLE_ID=MMETSP0367 /ASSEMBLY_ACC=CAM_ASM_000362 /LENGTH=309 /DNA_ID=CAMNT_0018641965 /DNA_START=54 /DNA_END=983 /DNA_ORIENTATION=-
MAKAAAIVLAAAASAWGHDVPSVLIAPGVEMPMIAFGTANSSFKGECTVQAGTEQWLKLGGRHIDTAWDYNTQLDVGRALKASGIPRGEVFITTKLPGPIGKDKVLELFTKESLPQLGIEYVDLLLIHFPCHHQDFPNKCGEHLKEERLDTWKGLMELKEKKLIRAAGVSNYLLEQVEEIVEATGSAPAVNQVEWHLGYHNETLLAGMKKLGVTLEAWSPLAGPTAGLAGHPGVSLSDKHLKALALKHNVSTAQVAFGWSVRKGVVPVTATCSEAHALGDLATFGFDLEDEEIATLDSLKPQVLDALVV